MSIILAQTDTTVGFLSQNASKLASIKKRDTSKPFLKVFASFKELKNYTRIPVAYRSRVRHAKKTTFVIGEKACRYVHPSPHADLIAQYGWLFSTSANESTKHYDETFCFSQSDLIVEDTNGFYETTPSTIIKLTAHNSKKLR